MNILVLSGDEKIEYRPARFGTDFLQSPVKVQVTGHAAHVCINGGNGGGCPVVEARCRVGAGNVTVHQDIRNNREKHIVMILVYSYILIVKVYGYISYNLFLKVYGYISYNLIVKVYGYIL